MHPGQSGAQTALQLETRHLHVELQSHACVWDTPDPLGDRGGKRKVSQKMFSQCNLVNYRVSLSEIQTICCQLRKTWPAQNNNCPSSRSPDPSHWRSPVGPLRGSGSYWLWWMRRDVPSRGLRWTAPEQSSSLTLWSVLPLQGVGCGQETTLYPLCYHGK